MKIENIIEFINSSTTADLILTVFIITIAIIVIVSIIYIGVYLRKLYNLMKQELSITNRHLSHLDPNKYASEYTEK